MIREFKIYLCGGMGKFGKDNFNLSNEWREDVKSHLIKMCDDRYFVNICNPNDYFSFLDDTTYLSNREIMEFDLNRVRKSDLIIVNFNDPKSIGSAIEIGIAYEMKIPVIGLCEDCDIDDLHPWLKDMSNRIFTDREDMLDYVINYYLD